MKQGGAAKDDQGDRDDTGLRVLVHPLEGLGETDRRESRRLYALRLDRKNTSFTGP